MRGCRNEEDAGKEEEVYVRVKEGEGGKQVCGDYRDFGPPY